MDWCPDDAVDAYTGQAWAELCQGCCAELRGLR